MTDATLQPEYAPVLERHRRLAYETIHERGSSRADPDFVAWFNGEAVCPGKHTANVAQAVSVALAEAWDEGWKAGQTRYRYELGESAPANPHRKGDADV